MRIEPSEAQDQVAGVVDVFGVAGEGLAAEGEGDVAAEGFEARLPGFVDGAGVGRGVERFDVVEERGEDGFAGASAPSSCLMLVAMAAISEAGSISKLTLMPGPRSAYLGSEPENSVSIRMPQTLRPERRTSFGHLICGGEAGRLLDRQADGERRDDAEPAQLVDGGAEDERDVDVLAGGGEPQAPEAATPGGLLFGEDDGAFGGAGLGLGAGDVHRGRCARQVDEAPADELSGEGVFEGGEVEPHAESGCAVDKLKGQPLRAGPSK